MLQPESQPQENLQGFAPRSTFPSRSSGRLTRNDGEHAPLAAISLLPHIPHYGYVLVFIVVFLNNLGIPLPGEMILLGAGFILGKAAGILWLPLAAGTAASFLGGICAFWLGRRLGQGGLIGIHWLHLTPERLKWPERYFERHGAKAVFIARFIAILPPMAANLMAGMTKIRWRVFLLYDLAGSVAFATSYILIGYVVGKQWKLLENGWA